MSFNFVIPEMNIGGNGNSPFVFYKRGFVLGNGTSPSWQDIILSGNTALTLTNALANGLNYLKLFGGTEQRNLPSGYTQVEYIESSGTQYIDTGITATNNTGIKVVYEYTNTGSAAIAGIFQNVNPRTDNLFVTSNSGATNSTLFCAQSGTQLNTSTIIAFDTKYTCEINYMNSGYMGFDGDITTQIGTNGVYDDKTIPLFARYSVSADNYAVSNSKIYSAIFTEGNVISHKLIPARRNSDNVLGMYDTVTGDFLTNAGTGSFTAGADVTPSPDTPIDIVCNNGVIKVRHQSGLPLGYTQVEYLESTGTQYIDMGIPLDSTDKVRLVAMINSYTSSKSSYFFGYFSNTTAFGLNCNTTSSYCVWGSRNSTASQVINLNTKYVFEISHNGFYINGNLEITNTDTFTNTDNAYLFFANGTSQKAIMGKIYECQVWKSGVLSRNFIPCRRNSDNVLGMYDTVSQTFLTNQGSGDFTAGNTVSDPIEIYIDGTQEVVTDSLGNTASAERLLAVGDYKDVQEVLAGSVTRNIGIKILDGTENWTMSGIGSILNPTRFAVSELIMFPNSNTIECLSTHYPFSGVAPTGESITSGTFNVGIYNNIHYIRFAPTDITTLEGWTNWLKAQYNAGQPVIIVYPLATATTESVTAQSLTTQAGTNIVEITQASIDNLGLEVSYKATV